MLTEAIEYYHSLLNDDVARENDAALSAALQREGLFFGTRPICIVLRPRLLGAEHYAQLQEVCSRVASAARQVVKFMLSDRAGARPDGVHGRRRSAAGARRRLC